MMYGENRENRVYLYGFDKTHQLQGKPWNLRGDWITVANIRDTAARMLRTYMDTVEVIVVDGSCEVGREYKDLCRIGNYQDKMQHVLFYEFLRSKPNFRFGLD